MSRVRSPAESKGSKPYRIYTDPYGDPSSRTHRPVTDAMTPLAGCVPPELALWRVRQLLEEQQLPGVPVVDAEAEILGILRLEDVLSAPRDHAACQAMHHALSLPAWTPIGKAAAIMASELIDLAAVVDYDRHVLGLLSALDIVRWLAQEEGYVVVRHH